MFVTTDVTNAENGIYEMIPMKNENANDTRKENETNQDRTPFHRFIFDLTKKGKNYAFNIEFENGIEKGKRWSKRRRFAIHDAETLQQVRQCGMELIDQGRLQRFKNFSLNRVELLV